MLARSAAGFLSTKFDTEVKIKTFYIKPDLRIHAEEVQINDKKHNPMFYVGKLDGKLSFRDITTELRVKNINIDDVLINIMKYEDEYLSNIAEMFSSDNEEKTKKTRTKIYLDELNLSKGHFVLWNQNKDNPEKKSMDYSHLDIDSVYMSMSKLSLVGDSIMGFINDLRGEEKSGFVLESFKSPSKILVSSKGLDIKNLKFKSHATSIDIDLQFLFNDYNSIRSFVDSVMIIANIRPSQLTLSDLRYFSPTMARMPDTLQINGSITGFVKDFTANNFNFSFKDSTNFSGTIKMKGLPNFYETHIVGDVKKMNFTYQDLSEFAIPGRSEKIPLPEMLSVIKNAVLSGEFYGFHNNFNTKFNLLTNIGNIYYDGAINNDLNIVPYPFYFFSLHTNNLNIKDILGLKNDFIVSFYTDMRGEGIKKKDADMQLDLFVEKLKYTDKEINDININGVIKNEQILASSNIKSQYADIDFNGMLDISKKEPSFDLKLKIDNADLHKLDLVDYDKKALLSTNVQANMRGFDIDKMFGEIFIDSTYYHDSRGSYFMDSLEINLTENHFSSKDLKINCDFFDADVNGILNFKKIGNTFKNYVLNHFHVRQWADKGVRLEDEEQDFYVNMNFKNTETLSNLLMPNLMLSNNTNFTATFTSKNYLLYSTLESDMIVYNNFILNDIYVKNKTERNKTTASLNLREFVMKEANEKNDVELGLENMTFMMDAHNDTLFFDLTWDDFNPEDKNKGKIEATFNPHEKTGGILHVTTSDVIINDSLWNISPTCYIDFKKNGVKFNKCDIYSRCQSLTIDGRFPKTSRDTIYLNFNKLNISNFDLLTAGYGIDVDGYVNGDLQVSGISDKFTFFSNLDVISLGINHHLIGDGFIDASWNAPDTSIFIDTEILRKNSLDKVLSLVGNYYTSRENENLDFNLNLNGVDISFVNSFTQKTLSRVGGKVNGDLLVTGSLKQMVLNGDAIVYDGTCNIDYLNTFYRINPLETRYKDLRPSIRFSKNRIDCSDIILVDSLNNHAVAQAVITHEYLRKFRFDVDATLDNFISMNMLPEESSTFYGTAVASGDLKIEGPLDDIVMDVNVLSMPGTVIDILLTSNSSINDNFIVFVQKEKEQDTVMTILPTKKKDKKFTFNLNADVTEDASVNIHLPSNMGNISANGLGSIRLGLASDQLSLYGDYVISEGTFVFDFQNLVRRNFNIRRGGTISWTGDAADADINVIGSYRTKSSISSLGIEIDSTSLVNNINVDCILRLQDKLNNPSITFGLELPNATDDIKNTVFSIIDTTNQAVMSQQIISLLVLGSFSYSNSGLSAIGVTNYYNVLTNSLSSWLSQISKGLDIGVRYTPEDNYTPEEFEFALSTQLFNDRLIIETNLGMYNSSQGEIAGGANSIVGDFDITFKLTNRLSLKGYNHSNLNSNYYTYSYETYSEYTQGLGLSYSQSFDSIKEIFARNRNKNKNKKNNKR